MRHISTLLIVLALLLPGIARAAGDSPIVTISSNAYMIAGEANLNSVLLGTTETGTYTVVDGLGTRQIEIGKASVDPSTGDFVGDWFQVKVPADGKVEIYGDASKIDLLVIDGLYITSINMDQLTNLEVLSLAHNSLEGLDLTPFTKLQAIYMTDNPFTAETPLKIGAPKNDLAILEIDMVGHLDQSFNLCDYPAMVSFDAYHTFDLYSIDPTGCPGLMSLSVEMTNVSTIDVSQNPELFHLNVSESRITSLDLSHNPKLMRLLAGHDSAFVNSAYKMPEIDLSNNPELMLLNLNGNQMNSIDLSHNTKLTNLSLTRNNLTSLDLSANRNLYSIWIMYNDMDFATLPLPEPTWGEYFYIQKPMPVSRSLAVGAELDMSQRVLRKDSQTDARVWRMSYDKDPELLEPSAYSYADGKISFNTALADSVYVEYANSLFADYTMRTTPFMVKNADEIGQPSKILSFVPASYGKTEFSVGMYGASPETPVSFMVDFGDGVLKEFQAVSALGTEASNVSGTPVGQVSIWIPEGEVMTEFRTVDVPLSSIDLTKATELVELQLRNAGLYDLDMRYNRCLADLDISGNNLYALDLQGIYGDYEKNVLKRLDASNNRITSFKNMASSAMRHLNLSHNQLAEISLKDYDNLETLDLSDNQLSEVNLEYMYSATDINLANNMIQSVTPCPTHMADHIDLSGNSLTYKSLPLPAVMGEGYVYAPQRQIQIPAEAPIVNLTDEDVYVGGNPTQFRWLKADGTPLAEGTDYTIRNGSTTFLDASLGQVYCVLENATFPLMTGDKALRTTETLVVGRPTYVAASFTTRGPASTGLPEFIVAGSQPSQVYVDWNGDGSELTSYDVETMYTSYPVDPDAIGRNKDVKVYVHDAEQARNLSVFSIYNIELVKGDFSPLTGLTSFNLGATDLSADNLVMPDAPLTELTLAGTRLTEYPYAEKYPNLYLLNLSANRFTSFDASIVPGVAYLVLSGNKISDVHFDNPNMWSLQLDMNELETIDLSGLPAMEQLVLNSNKFESIDLSPVSSTLQGLSIVGNRFKYSTLPIQNEYPNLLVYYYGNQAPIDAKCLDMTVDLSSEAVVGQEPTTFTWYAGVPVYNPETQMIEGNLLVEGTDYEIEGGVTHFLKNQPDGVLCMMANPLFPNLTQITDLIALDYNAVEGIDMDANGEVEVYSLQGVLIRKGAAKEALSGLEPGIYIVNGRKMLVK